MADDDKSVLSVNSSLPKCVCSWKFCRNYQRTFRDKHHDVYNGVIKIKFNKDDESSMALKNAWDRHLRTEESKREKW